MKRRFFVCVIVLAVGMISCKSAPKSEGEKSSELSKVYVTNTKKISLLPPDAIDGVVDTAQLLQGKFGDQSFTLQAYIYADETSINMNLFNDFGTDMGYLFYDGENALFESAVFPPELPAEYIINDLQCAYYNAEKLKENFEASGLTFKNEMINFEVPHDEYGASVETRTIFSGKNKVAEIFIYGGTIKVVNILRGYEYVLNSFE